ncbi:MAG TPA: helix-turn-helix domain-containing protein [Kofleriaceae bacterium]|nr:helix-turn-helix domain-containing protein [Kofleriaceae bacterium]
MERVDLLLRSPLFAAMPRAAVAELAVHAVRRRVRRGHRVMARRDAALVVLVTGRIELVGDGLVIRSLMPPAVAGVSLAVGAPPSAELRAAEDSAIIVLPAAAVAAALRRHPEAAFAAIAHLAGVIAELSAEIEALRRHGLVERVRHRLAQLGRGRREIAITHAALADEVGGSRANVSRALARLERAGVVRRRRGVIALR